MPQNVAQVPGGIGEPTINGLQARKAGCTLAEGVETAEQLRFLIDAGCDAIQGFYFSRPVPPEEIPALVRQAAVNSPMMMPLCKAPESCPH